MFLAHLQRAIADSEAEVTGTDHGLPSVVLFFTARSSYASAVLGIVILSVCPSVRLSVTHVLCDETKKHASDILIPHERIITVVLIPTEADGRYSLSREICP